LRRKDKVKAADRSGTRLAPRLSCSSFRGLPLWEVPPKSADKFYAFASSPGSPPRVFTYEDSEEGVAELSNLIRSEDVMAVIKGVRVKTSQSSVVELSVRGNVVAHKLSYDMRGA